MIKGISENVITEYEQWLDALLFSGEVIRRSEVEELVKAASWHQYFVSHKDEAIMKLGRDNFYCLTEDLAALAKFTAPAKEA